LNFKRKKRLAVIVSMLTGVGVSVSLVLFALNKNINLYYTPSELKMPLPKTTLRIGGLVKKGSLKHVPNSLKISFQVTDLKREIQVQYTGITPSLFREGQGVVVEGQFSQAGTFNANQVLAKHDEKYMPPGMKKLKAH
jgi:cytochrome c-type biogenesis protein CcmE